MRLRPQVLMACSWRRPQLPQPSFVKPGRSPHRSLPARRSRKLMTPEELQASVAGQRDSGKPERIKERSGCPQSILPQRSSLRRSKGLEEAPEPRRTR